MDFEIRYSESDYSRVYVVLPPNPETKEPGRVVEAALLTPSSVVNPNKKTMAAVKRLEHHEREVIKEFSFIQQSKLRGETTEDRAARLLMSAEDEAEAIETQMPIAAVGGSSATVVPLNRFSGNISRMPRPGSMSAQIVSQVETDSSIFSDRSGGFRLKDEWESDDDE